MFAGFSQFAKSEMGGAEFKAVFKQLSSEFYEVKDRLKIDGKPKKDEKIDIRNKLSRQVKFAAGVLGDDVRKVAGLKRATVWLSDDTLIKQVDSREGQDFGADYYAFLPDFFRESGTYRQGWQGVVFYDPSKRRIFMGGFEIYR